MHEENTGPDHGQGRLRRTLSVRGVESGALVEAWRNPEVQRQVMAEFADWLGGDAGSMRWRLHLPMDRELEVESREVGHEPGRRVRHATRSTNAHPASMECEFFVQPAPAGRGTEAVLAVEYAMPGGVAADMALKLFGAVPDVLAGRVLRRFKALMEAGEIPTLARNPSARDRD